MLWVLIRAILMSTHNICFYGEITKIIPKLSSNTVLGHTVMTLLLFQQRSLGKECRPGQTVQTQIRLEEQSDQGLHCLQFSLHLLNALL